MSRPPIDVPPPDPRRLLCSAADLAAWNAGPQPRPVCIDVGFDLADGDAGERDYARERLPRAFYAHLERDLSAPKPGGSRDPRGRHPLPERDAFARLVGTWGIGADTPVVVYDRQGSMFAVRLWWMLRWLGHDLVAVLDGGWRSWQAAGFETERGEPTARPAAAGPAYPTRPSRVRTIDAPALLRELGRIRLIDARASERFRGEVEPLDPVAGHIPGALNRFFQHNLETDGRFRSPAQLRLALEPLVGRPGDGSAAPVVHHCGSGVTACHNVFAQELAGLGPSLLYPGSWSEWCSDPARPVARS
jgi:thiosulfate/3-mercaptopyruvate sulfurtransferase